MAMTATETVVTRPNRAVACAGSKPFAAYVEKKLGKTAVITVVKYTEFAQSYQAHARCSGVTSPTLARSRAIMSRTSYREQVPRAGAECRVMPVLSATCHVPGATCRTGPLNVLTSMS